MCAAADDLAEGSLAFAAQDYETAALFWQKAADNGSAEASLQLGHLAERGLGMKKDLALAFDYFLVAAQSGLPEAAVNVGVMLDAGTGVKRDSTAASVWYARAAVAGNDRGAFLLGIMYQDGTGVPVNDDLASFWLERALNVPHPEKEAGEPSQNRSDPAITAAMPLAAAVRLVADEPIADLIWTAPPGPETSFFAVQVVAGDGQGDTSASLMTEETNASALQVRIPPGGALWRVVRVDPVSAEYRASPWQHQLSGESRNPTGLVTIAVNQGDDAALEMAQNLVRAFGTAHLIVTVSATNRPIEVSSIKYRYRQDAALASDLADFLPGFGGDMVSQSENMATGPGEVIVNLAMGLGTTATP